MHLQKSHGPGMEDSLGEASKFEKRKSSLRWCPANSCQHVQGSKAEDNIHGREFRQGGKDT